MSRERAVPPRPAPSSDHPGYPIMTDTIQVQTRSIAGSKVEQLRREGVMPATVYGRGVESLNVQLPYTVARDLMNHQGQNTLLNLSVEGESTPRQVVIRQAAQHPVTRKLLHLEFFQVDMGHKLRASVAITPTGEAPAVARWGGMVVQVLDQVLVEALPQNLPEQIEVSLNTLGQIDSQVFVRDLVPANGVTVLGDPNHLVLKIQRTRATAAVVTPAAAAAPAKGKGKK